MHGESPSATKREQYLQITNPTHNSPKYYSHSYPQICHSPPTLQEAFMKLNIGGGALSQDTAQPITLANRVQAKALHINGLTPHCDKTHNRLMNYNPCARVDDLEAICKDILKAVGPNSTNAYTALKFT
jgi:hypothetical protein